MLSLDELFAFRTVAVSGSFTSAAEQLHLTQSTISHQMRRLEDHLGQKLFIRTTRSVRLTQAGERLLPYAEQLLDTAQAAQRSLAVNTVSGRVRLGVPEEFAYQQLPALLDKFRLHYPKVELVVEVGLSQKLREQQSAGALDITIVKEAPPSQAALRTEPLVWMGTPQVLSIDPLPVGFLPGPCSFRSEAVQALAECGRNYSVILTSASLLALKVAAEHGSVVTVLAQSQCPPEFVLNAKASGLPALPEMGYRVITGNKPSEPIRIAVEIIHELLGAARSN